MDKNKLNAITASIDELLADDAELLPSAPEEATPKTINSKILDVLGINVQVRDAETYEDL